MHGPQQVYRVETITCALASELASPGDDIILDNQSVVKATPIKRKGVVKDLDYRDIGYHNTSSKRLTIRWTPGHRTLEQATTYNDYQDIHGNHHSDVLANMGDSLPPDSQQPQPHDIVIIGQIMPTPAKVWIMQVRRQKQTLRGALGELAPHETLQTKCLDPMAVGAGKVVGNRCPLGKNTHSMLPVWPTTRSISAIQTGVLPRLALWRRSGTDWAQHTYQLQQTATSQELWLCARLLIPLSLVDAIPTTERHKLRTEVGLFQFRMIQAVQTLRRKLANPTPHQPPSPLWLTKYVAHTLPLRETPQP